MVWHVLKPNHSSEMPQSLLFLDTETFAKPVKGKTNSVEHVFKLGVACHVYRHDGRLTEKWCTTWSLPELWDFIASAAKKQKKLYIFAHNWNYDWFIINGFGFLKKYDYTIVKHVMDSQRFILQARKKDSTIVMVDTGNYVKMPLSKIGESIGLQKLKVDFDNVSDERLAEYCRRDVEILKRFVLGLVDFIQLHNLGCFKPTVAGLAFTAYRHRFMNTQICIHEHVGARLLEEKAYHGGRCEAFYIGEKADGPFYKLDVNSMYPFVMMKYQYPTKLVKVVEDTSLNGLRRAIKRYAVIADVEASIDEPAVAVKLDKLVFPVGDFRACLTSPELEYVLQYGKIKNVYAMAIYEMGDVFSEYVKYFYSLKNEYKKANNGLYYLLTKLYLNSLYGKFGQRSRVFSKLGEKVNWPDGIHIVFDVTSRKKHTYWVLNGDCWEVGGLEPGRDSLVAIPAFVTAYARMYLWQLIKTANVNHVFYVDTDSLIVDEAGYNNLKDYVNDNELGRLKVEGISSKIVILGAKRYQFENDVHVKGVHGNITSIWQSDYEQERWLKARSLLRLGITDKVVIEYYVKHLKNVYDKGVVQPDGRVKPLEVK